MKAIANLKWNYINNGYIHRLKLHVNIWIDNNEEVNVYHIRNNLDFKWNLQSNKIKCKLIKTKK